MNPFDLKGKAALVTGGNGGIGLGMAKGLAQAGAAIAIAGRDEKKNAQAVKELKASGVQVISISADVRKALAGHDTDEAHARYTHLAFTKQTEALAKLSAIGGWR